MDLTQVKIFLLQFENFLFTIWNHNPCTHSTNFSKFPATNPCGKGIGNILDQLERRIANLSNIKQLVQA